MRASFLDGKGLAARLPGLISSCHNLDIAMAYVKLGALDSLLRDVEDLLERGGSLRMVFGLSSSLGITDKKAAERLLELTKKRNVSIHKNNNPGFHPKLFIFQGEHPVIAVGSSNLTKGAQSTNAEANVLLEDIEQRLVKDASEFFDDCFRRSPALKKQHVKRYREKRKVSKSGRRESPEEFDPLPTSTQRLGEMAELGREEIWKISPGEGAEYWDEWFEGIDDLGNGIIAIGWDVGSLDRFKSYDSLKKAVAQYKKRQNEDFYVKTATDQLWAFKMLPQKRMASVIAYSKSRVFGIAQITPDSRYSYDTWPIQYPHQITVKYLWSEEWPRVTSKYLRKQLGKQTTLLRIENQKIGDDLLRGIPAVSSSSAAQGDTRLHAESPFGYVFPHTEKYLPEGPKTTLQTAAEHPQEYWHHGEAAGPWEGGFKFIIGFEGKIHGEFEVEKRERSEDPTWRWRYALKPGTIYYYNPPRPYKELVRQMHFHEGVTEASYSRFLKGTKRLKID